MSTTTGITVPGTAGGNIVVSTGQGDYLKLAQQMATLLNGARFGNSFTVATVTAGSAVGAAPSGSPTELGVTGAGGVATNVPSSWNYVVNVTSSPDTIVSSNNQVLSGDQGATIIETGTNTVAATGGNNFVNDIGNYLISTSTGNDTIFASGSGTVAAGIGANFVSVSGSNNYVVAAGNGDTIRQGSGATSVLAVGTNSTIAGSSNPADSLTISLGGSGNVVFAGSTQAAVTIGAYSSTLPFNSPNGVTDPVTTTGSGNIVVGGSSPSGTLTVVDLADFAIISGAADSVVSATVSGNNTNVFGGSGVLNVSASGSNDSVAAGSAASFVTVSGSAAYLFGNTSGGILTALDGSNGSVISLRSETTSTITLTGSNSKVIPGGGTLNLSVTGSNDTVYAGSGAETIQTTNNTLVYAPSGGIPLNFVGGSGGVPTLVGGTGGSEHVTVGGSGISFSAGINDNSTITSGTGQATVFGSAGATVTFIGTAAGGAQFHAYGGNETLSGAGSTTNNLYYGSSVAGSTTNLIGGSGSNTFFAGSNTETMTGGGNNEVFAILRQATSVNAGGAHVTITDFNSTDTIFMVGYDSTQSASTLLAHATGPAISGSGPGLTLTLSDNTTVTFTNLTSVSPLFGKIGYF